MTPKAMQGAQGIFGRLVEMRRWKGRLESISFDDAVGIKGLPPPRVDGLQVAVRPAGIEQVGIEVPTDGAVDTTTKTFGDLLSAVFRATVVIRPYVPKGHGHASLLSCRETGLIARVTEGDDGAVKLDVIVKTNEADPRYAQMEEG